MTVRSPRITDSSTCATRLVARPQVLLLFGSSGDPRGSAAALDGTVAAWVDRRRIYLQRTSRLLSGFLH